jgi:hypothetical protein
MLNALFKAQPWSGAASVCPVVGRGGWVRELKTTHRVHLVQLAGFACTQTSGRWR